MSKNIRLSVARKKTIKIKLKGWIDGLRYQTPISRLKKLYNIDKETSPKDGKLIII